jgi:hypothetical protein
MRSVFAAIAVAAAISGPTASVQEPPPPAPPGKRRVSPPQPQQVQGVDYLAGTWRVTWTGRESQVTTGPRSGTVTFARRNAGSVLDLRVEGTAESGTPFKETGTAEWDAANKTLTLIERLATGVELRSVGDWSSPIGIRAESDPVKVGAETVKVRRLYNILSAESFMVTEEISVNGGPYQRLGNGRFQRVP